MVIKGTSYTQVPVDKHVESVRKQMYDRMIHGWWKYGTNTERKDLDVQQWLQHLQEELMDACVYVETLKEKLNERS